MRTTFLRSIRPSRGTKRRWIARGCAVAALLLAIGTWIAARWQIRYGAIVGPFSVSFAAGQAEAVLWWTARTDVFSSYDTGWSASRELPDPASGWMGTVLGGRWRWIMPEGGNEVVPPHVHRVWAIPGFVEYQCDTSLWADGGAARSLAVMLWPLPLLALASAWGIARSARTARRRWSGACARCGHALTADQTICPECGAARRRPVGAETSPAHP